MVVELWAGIQCGGFGSTMLSFLQPTAPLHPLHSCRDRLLAQDVWGVALVGAVVVAAEQLAAVLVVVSAVPLV